MKEAVFFIVLAGFIGGMLALLDSRLGLRRHECASWVSVTWPEETITRTFYVTDEDGYTHKIGVPEHRPAHQHKVCEAYK